MSALASYSSVRTEGALLPSDILLRISAQDRALGGLDPDSYHLDLNDRIRDATSRAWNRAQAAWANFDAARGKLGPGEAGTTVTRERWLLPLFQLFDFGRLQTAKPETIGERSYAISHGWQHVPIHLVGCAVDIDRRVETPGGKLRSSPHSLLQEFLNRSDGHLWGVVSNGLRLRLLRDNVSLTRQAFVEFDLEAMMAGESYPDFVLLWLLLHQSRFEGERPELCWLEKWSQAARTEGVRVLEGLRDGVQAAIEAFGKGFLAHPANVELRDRLRSGALKREDYYRQALRLVYRLLFLFVAEDRDLLVRPDADPAARDRYLRHYATTRLRRLASSRASARHSDLWYALRLVMDKLSGDGCPELGLPALGGFLFSPAAVEALRSCELANSHLLEAIRALAVTQTGQSRRTVDYRNLGAEELGSVYESLLELHPELNAEAATFELKVAAGSERKKTGSYYTPTSLISCLLDSALDPVLDGAARSAEPEKAILKLKVVDPACGSGHFLIAAAHRIARRLAAARTGEDEPPPEAHRHALRDVIGHCIYGVDLNPMAVELCKVSLWMEALEPGKPLSFLEHRIQCGNSLLGATPALLAAGIPDKAFTPLQGDDPEICRDFKRINADEREKQMRLFAATTEAWLRIGNLPQAIAAVDSMGDGDIVELHEKERRWEEAVRSADYLDARFWADAWCAAFVWKKTKEFQYPITEEVFRRIELNPHACEMWTRVEIERLAAQYRFFHWHLAFPDVFRATADDEKAENVETGWIGGFDAVLGNPPWERIKLQEREWFASRRPDIANAPNAAARGRMIRTLEQEDPLLLAAFREDLRQADGESALVRNTGRYPLCGKGDINTYAAFAESDRTLLGRRGRMGVILPSGIATANTTKDFFAALISTGTLVTLYSFFEIRKVFLDTDSRDPFCLLSIAGSPQDEPPEFAFDLDTTEDLSVEQRRFTLSATDIELINPNTRTCPIFRSKRDAEITKAIYRRVPVLVNDRTHENPWGISFQRMLDMANDSNLFRTRGQLETDGWELHGNIFSRDGDKYLPLYEAKMMHQFTHRFGDYAMRAIESQGTELPRIPASRLADPDYVVQPRYWVPEWEVVKATSRVPRAVVEAVEAESEDIARKALSLWFAGYALNHGDNQAGNEILFQNLGSLFKSVPDAMGDWLVAKGTEAEYPLDDSDFRVGEPGITFLIAAQRLIRKRMPTWLLGFRDVVRATDERTAIFGVLPPVGVGHKAPLAFMKKPQVDCLSACFNSLAFDYITRQSLGGTSFGYFILKQLATLPPSAYAETHQAFVRCRVLELTYTSWDLAGFARELGYDGPPFRWADERRFLMRCELDALCFHLYGIARIDVDYITDTFPIVRRKDEQQFGEYRTKRVILEIYDEMAAAGPAYATRLDPPPADPRVAHPAESILEA